MVERLFSGVEPSSGALLPVGDDRAHSIASETMREVRAAMGLGAGTP